jgi:acetate kinase
MDILVLNSGSSSLKYTLYRWEDRMVLAKGIVERVTQPGSFIIHEVIGNDRIKVEQECPTHKEAVDLIMQTLTEKEGGVLDDPGRIKAVGHRVVHGGEKFNKSVIIPSRNFLHLLPFIIRRTSSV